MNRTNKCGQKEKNPILTANFLSKWTFWWVHKLFRQGFSRPLTEEELYEHAPSLDSERITNKFIKLWDVESKRKNPNILKMLIRAYGGTFLPLAISYAFAQSISRILQPIFLGNLVSYFGQKNNDTSITKTDAYLYATGIAICSLVPVLTFHPYIFYIFNLGTKFRLGCAGLIYRKTLRISKTATNDGLSARAINILSNDLSKFDIALAYLHDLWKGPMETIILGYVMYREIGVAAIIGIVFLLSFIPLQAWGAKKAAAFRSKGAERTDLRVKLMNEIIQGIQLIKMYAWEKSFANVIAKVRRKEIIAIRGSLRIYASLATTSMISIFSIFFSLISYVYITNDDITARKIFMVTAIFNVLKDSMVHFWPLGVTYSAEAYISTKRVKEFLLENEGRKHVDSDIIEDNPKNFNETDQAEYYRILDTSGKTENVDLNGAIINRRIIDRNAKQKGITIKMGSASWYNNSDDIKDKSVAIQDFNLDIKENSLTAVVGPVGAGKSTLLNVILGELDLTSGSITVNGKLSYCCQEPWLFEGTVRDNIVFIEEFDAARYEKVIKVCALERDLELLAHGDSTIVGERGISLSGGQKARVNLARAVYKQADIYLLDDPLSAVDTHVGKHIFDRCIKQFLADKICILVTHQLQYLQNVEHLVLIKSGLIETQGSYKYLQELNQFDYLTENHDESTESQQRSRRESASEADEQIELLQRENSATEDTGEDRKEQQAVGIVKFSVYKSYFKALENCCYIFSIVVIFIVCRILLSSIDYFISRWVNWEESVRHTGENTQNNDDIEFKRKQLIIIYSSLVGTTLILYICRTFGFFQMCIGISLRLHDKLFRGITRAQMYFFNMNPSGRILNRFSKDISAIDTVLPQSLLDCVSCFTDVTAILIIVCITNYWLIIPAVVAGAIFYVLRIVYLNTSRSITRIELTTRSPIYTHTNQTFQGLTTIRALQAESQLEKEFHNCQNANTSASYLFLATTRAFALWLDFVCVIYIAVTTYSFLLLENQFTSGDVGLAIIQCVSMVGMCQWGIRQTAELENQMTSVERILEYVEQKPEPPLETTPENRPPENWPSKGRIEFENFNLRYAENGEYRLNNLNFKIEPNEKLGIVGRTGAGKSSIIQSIFRLAFNEGTIKIDDIDINKLGLHDLRSKISIIPQDPVIFSGTLRNNLDPFETATDNDLWMALNEVELKPHIQKLIGGLNCKMSDGGSNFSMGQRQLLCLARAILRNNKILILDEATANVDPETDKLIQKTIRSKFDDCTVLTIAHRLHTVMDSDRVLVMDAGQAVEIGHPHELLSDPNGFFRKLVDQTGTQTALALGQTAADAYNLK